MAKLCSYNFLKVVFCKALNGSLQMVVLHYSIKTVGYEILHLIWNNEFWMCHAIMKGFIMSGTQLVACASAIPASSLWGGGRSVLNRILVAKWLNNWLFTAKTQQPVMPYGLMKTVLNSILLPRLFNIVNNIVQHCSA